MLTPSTTSDAPSSSDDRPADAPGSSVIRTLQRGVERLTRRRPGSGAAAVVPSLRQAHRDTVVLCTAAYALYAAYMALPGVNLIVAGLAAIAVAMGIRHHGGDVASWRAWTIAVGLTLVGVLMPLLAQRAGLCHGHGMSDLAWRLMGKTWSVVWSVLGARCAAHHLPEACRWAVRAKFSSSLRSSRPATSNAVTIDVDPTLSLETV